jgi:FkbM family methyltransferase
MQITNSLRQLSRLSQQDFSLFKSGAPLGWLLHTYYMSRWQIKRGRSPSPTTVKFKCFGEDTRIVLTSFYLGPFRGIFLDHEYDCSSLFNTPPKRILDLGANIGMGTIFLGRQFPESQIICVEPDPRNLPLLERNLLENSIDSTIVKGAVGPTSGSLMLRFGDNPTCSALESSPMHDLQQAVQVDVVTVPEIMSDEGWDSIDFLKIDIEGSEDDLLSQENSWLAKVGVLILEIHPNTTSARIQSFLEPFGFVLQRFGHSHEPTYVAFRP